VSLVWSLAWRLAAPLLGRLDAETAHDLAIRALAWGLAGGGDPSPSDDLVLAQELWGRRFVNPVGLAAGFDKDARAAHRAGGLGFGLVEVGTVTPRPQAGNPRPRLFRLANEHAVINRMGFNNAGAEAVAGRLAALSPPPRALPIGINLGRNKDASDEAADYARAAKVLGRSADYLVVNVSSPNTPGLRALQDPARLAEIIDAVRAVLSSGDSAQPPLLVKLAPDLEEADLDDIARAALDLKLDGLIATNTTVARPEGLKGQHAGETGGLSGRPLMQPATRVLSGLYARTEGQLVLIGVGGIASGADAYAKVRAGASLVQLYTALVYEGPGLVGRIKRELRDLLRRDGFANVSEAVGADHR